MTFCQSKGGIPYFETSAKEAINVEQAFEGKSTAACPWRSLTAQSLPETRSSRKNRRNSAETSKTPSTFTLRMTGMGAPAKFCLFGGVTLYHMMPGLRGRVSLMFHCFGEAGIVICKRRPSRVFHESKAVIDLHGCNWYKSISECFSGTTYLDSCSMSDITVASSQQ